MLALWPPITAFVTIGLEHSVVSQHSSEPSRGCVLLLPSSGQQVGGGSGARGPGAAVLLWRDFARPDAIGPSSRGGYTADYSH